MLRYVAAAAALALALGQPTFAAAETLDLGEGRSLSVPDSFVGCGPATSRTFPNGVRSFAFNCSMTIENKPANVSLTYTTLPPNNTAPRAYIEGFMTRLNRAAMIGDPSMGIQRKTLGTAGKPGAFLCWAYDDVPSLTGAAICALDLPSTRFSLMVTTKDAYTAMRAMEKVAALSTLR